MPITAGDLEAFVDGDVGWVADRPMLDVGDGNPVAIRFTAVFLREDGDWKLVQSHGSIGLPNESSFGELPTYAPRSRSHAPRQPTVDHQADAGHVGGAFRAQERDHVAHLPGLAQAPDGDVRLRM